MTPERYAQITRLCQAAMELNARERAAFLAQACAGDDELRAEVEELLASDAAENSFIDVPALDVAARIFAHERPSLSGQRLGHYQILRPLGAGGMGEVYLAQDIRLHRKVALKLLPAAFTQDAERLRRFRQEALTASALNHPNILTVYDIGESDGRQYIVTEYVEGQSLRQRLLQGTLPLNEVLEIALQIANALSAAHAAGIVHRDIKPENVMVRPDGLVKVLDFGLAKLSEIERSADADAETRSKIQARTQPGTVMGTINYMSPEQALGQEVDARTDIFSFGVVLYEMITGSQPFTGPTDGAIYAAIINQQPAPISVSQSGLPVELEWIINRALEKDREVRYQTASDLRAALKGLKRDSESGKVASAATASSPLQERRADRRGRKFVIRAVNVASLLVIPAIIIIFLLKTGKEKTSAPAALNNATFTQLTNQSGQEVFPSLSPDGKLMIYANAQRGNGDIYFQRVGGETPINLTKDCADHDTQPAFSPNGDVIAFRSERDGGGLFLMGATGENVRRLTTQGYYPAWSPDGQEIVYALGYFSYGPHNRSVVPSALHVVNVQTGVTRLLATGDAVQPSWSPHRHRIAYWGIHRGGQRSIWTIAASGGTPVLVTDDTAVNWNPVWSPDGQYLYFASDRSGSMNLWRVPIDEQTGQVRGTPEPLTTPATYSSSISFARDGGRLVYVESKNQINLQEVAFDPVKKRVTGAPQWITQGSRTATQQHVSLDQQWIVFDSIGDRQEDLFVIRRDGTGLRQLTNDPFKDRAPRWSPDGKHIIFFTDRTGRYELWQINPDGSDVKQLTWTTGPGIQMPHWSPDGKQILCSLQNSPPFLFDPALPWSQQSPQSLPKEGFPEGFLVSSWSTDGKTLLGYRNGLISYSFATQKYERLTDSGYLPVWLNDGRHALFIATDKLQLLDTHTRQITDVLSVAPRLLQCISVSKDNRFLSLSVNTTESDIWMATLPKDQ